jgi:hypothetical protein
MGMPTAYVRLGGAGVLIAVCTVTPTPKPVRRTSPVRARCCTAGPARAPYSRAAVLDTPAVCSVKCLLSIDSCP